jgi:hypothetical protein
MIDLTGKDQSWWPDLTGKTVAILASGPSMTRAQCDLVRGTDWFSIAINETWRLAPWAAVLYGCDWQWWQHKAPSTHEFGGKRVVGTVANIKNKKQLPPEMEWQEALLNYLPVVAGQSQPLWRGPAVGAGSNSAFQVANWVARCGAKQIVLLGVDCHSPNEHWHGGHDHRMAQHQKPHLMKAWLMAWQNAAPQFTERGISVINCAPGSALGVFPRGDLGKISAGGGVNG